MVLLNGPEKLSKTLETKVSEEQQIVQIVGLLKECLHENLSAIRDILQKRSQEERELATEFGRIYYQFALQKVLDLVDKYNVEDVYKALHRYMGTLEPPF